MITATTLVGLWASPAHAADYVSNWYSNPDNWLYDDVTWSNGRGGCSTQDPIGPYTIVHPTELGRDGTDHPVIVWGNGTSSSANATCSYQNSLRHLAGWGFVVISPNDGSVGSGSEMLGALNHIIGLNATPGSVFYDRIDVNHIGAMGHSQGAGGAINLAKQSSQVDAVATLSFTDPNPLWWGAVFLPVPNATGVTADTFFVHSSTDWLATAGGQQTYYNQVSGPAIRATQVGGDHNNLFASTGYITAWMRYQLFGDILARSAFVGSPGEIFTNPGFQGVVAKSLP